MRKRNLIVTTLLFTAFASFAAFAGQWKQDAKGWWWDNGDGTYPVSTWQWIDVNNDHVAECYYFDQDGYLLTSTTTPDGCAVNADGQWVEKVIPDDCISAYKNKYDGRYMVKVFIPEDSPLTLEPGVYKSTYDITYISWSGPNYIDTDYYINHNLKVIDDGENLKFKYDFDEKSGNGDYWFAGTLKDKNDGYYEAIVEDSTDEGDIYGVYVISDDVIIVETGDGGDGDYHGFYTMKKVS